jgi:hypothetical protein
MEFGVKNSQSLQAGAVCVKPRRVKFDLNRLKIENLAGYFNDEVIDLTPPFQRGSPT